MDAQTQSLMNTWEQATQAWQKQISFPSQLLQQSSSMSSVPKPANFATPMTNFPIKSNQPDSESAKNSTESKLLAI